MTKEEIAALMPMDFAPESRVWIYQSSRPFNEREATEIDEQLHHFYAQWLAHGREVKGWAKLVFNRFIIMMADESEVQVSGCSTDSSARIIKSLERQYSVDLFNRLSITFLLKGKAEVLPLNQVQYAIDKGFIDEQTQMFNNTVTTKQDLLDNWLLPLGQSWLKTRVNFNITKD
jgi:hypothetical protein